MKDWKYFTTPEEVEAAQLALQRMGDAILSAQLQIKIVKSFARRWNLRMAQAESVDLGNDRHEENP